MKKVITLLSLLLFTGGLFCQDDLSIEKRLTNNEYDDRYASYSPDGERIVFESNRTGDWEVYLMDKEGRNVERLTNNGRINRRPSWHPKGKMVLFESLQDEITELRTIKIKRKRENVIKQSEKGETFLFSMYSSNGKKIAVSLKESENKSNIVVLGKRGEMIREVTQNEYRNYYPKWSNDGDELVYFSRKETSNEDDEIYRIELGTGKELRLTNWHKNNFCASWSSDDSKIAYVTSMEETRPEIFIMNADGSNKKRITVNEEGDTLPNWHPSENKILITAYRNGNYQICEIAIE